MMNEMLDKLSVAFLIRFIRFISQLIRLARVSSHVDDFNTGNTVLTAKFLRQGLDIINFVRRFQKFIGGILTWCLNIMSD